MKKLFSVIIAVTFVLVTSCSKKDNKTETVMSQEVSVQEIENMLEQVSVTKSVKKMLSSPEYTNLKDMDIMAPRVSAKEHEKYLSEAFEFKPLTGEDYSDTDISYVVGSDLCVLYPAEAFSFENPDFPGTVSSDHAVLINEDTSGYEKIPLGTILKPAGTDSSIRNADRSTYYGQYGYFYIDDNYHYFYRVEYNGKTGFVFGSDLVYKRYGSSSYCTLSTDKNENRIFSESLLTDGAFESFHALEGLKPLTPMVQKGLSQNRLAMQETEEIYISYDDIVDNYSYVDKYTPMFITTDLASHTQHLFFDRLLSYTEENYFAPRLKELCAHFIDALKKDSDIPEDIKELAVSYFQVPELILRLAPVKETMDGWPHETVYVSVTNEQEILSEYSEKVLADYNKVKNANGSKSEIFGIEEDFSQYRPRGHYDKNGVLQSYFMAEMWFGRIHFTIAKSDINPETDLDCAVMEPVAMAIVNTVHKNPNLYEEWANLFDPITQLIGDSDDLSFYEVLPLWKNQNVTDFSSWASDKNQLSEFVKICHEKLRPPAISSNSVFRGPSEIDNKENIKPPMGWRLFGQRFTYDSNIHQQVCAPYLYERNFVRGLDIMKVFGSNSADYYLSITDYLEPDEDGFKGGIKLKNTLDSLQAEYDAYDSNFWTKNYYNNILAQVKAQANFEQGSGFYFTESPMWNIKSLISSHSTWAELRHDTILYVKQNYAERGGDGDLDPTYRSREIKPPVNYIEPDETFWKTSLTSIANLVEVFDKYNLLDEETDTDLSRMSEIYLKALQICRKEISDEKITEDENSWIRTVPRALGDITRCHEDSYGIADKDSVKMACIADVFTNAESGLCLEVGVGRPYKLYVPLNDKAGKRIAVGFIPSYYEFYHSMNDRMTDAMWKKKVYKDNESLEDYMPFWEKSCVIPAGK